MPRDTKFYAGSNRPERPAEVEPDPVNHDPILKEHFTPRRMNAGLQTWQAVADMYYTACHRYARIAEERRQELMQQAESYRKNRIDQLDRSTNEYERLQEQVKVRDGEIAQLKATIHLLTAPRRS